MYDTSFYPQVLQNFDWYKNHLPLFLRQSEGFLEHYRIWFDLLVGKDGDGIIPVGDQLLYAMNIMDADYLDFINGLDNNSGGTKSSLLDLLGGIFGVSRTFTVNYLDEGVMHKADLNLDNNDFLILIRAKIIKNYFKGTREDLANFYLKANLGIVTITKDPPAHAAATCKLFGYTDQYSNDVIIMFKAHLLNIESFGIDYDYTVTIVSYGTLLWDVGDWDNERWTA